MTLEVVDRHGKVRPPSNLQRLLSGLHLRGSLNPHAMRRFLSLSGVSRFPCSRVSRRLRPPQAGRIERRSRRSIPSSAPTCHGDTRAVASCPGESVRLKVDLVKRAAQPSRCGTPVTLACMADPQHLPERFVGPGSVLGLRFEQPAGLGHPARRFPGRHWPRTWGPVGPGWRRWKRRTHRCQRRWIWSSAACSFWAPRPATSQIALQRRADRVAAYRIICRATERPPRKQYDVWIRADGAE